MYAWTPRPSPSRDTRSIYLTHTAHGQGRRTPKSLTPHLCPNTQAKSFNFAPVGYTLETVIVASSKAHPSPGDLQPERASMPTGGANAALASGSHLDLDPSGSHLDLDPSGSHLDLDPSGPHLDLDPSGPHLDLDPSGSHLDLDR